MIRFWDRTEPWARKGDGFLTGEVYRTSDGLRCGDTNFVYLLGCGGSSWLGKLSLDAASRSCSLVAVCRPSLLGSRGSRHGIQ